MILPEGEPVPFVGWVDIDTKKINNLPRELSDEEILDIGYDFDLDYGMGILGFARAILKKASEK